MIYHLSMALVKKFLSMCYNVRKRMRQTILTLATALAATAATFAAYCAETPCKKCHGSGTVVAWVPCPNCNGNVMSGGTRCKNCIRSIKTGQVRDHVPCPVCRKSAAQNRNVGFGDNRVFAAHGETQARRNHVRNQIRAAIIGEKPIENPANNPTENQSK